MEFFERLLELQNEIKVAKNNENKFGKYKFRSAEDILEALKPLALKHRINVTITDEIKQLGEYIFTEATVTLSSVDSDQKTISKGQAGISPLKGMSTAQTFGASSSYARKYGLNAALLLDDTKDTDSVDNTPKAPKKASNKPVLSPTSDKWQKAKDAVANGWTIDQLRQHYDISDSNFKKLQ